MSKGKLVAVIGVWLVILGIATVVLRVWIFPSREAAQQAQVSQEREILLTQTSAESRFDHDISFVYDKFTGYLGTRSARMKHHTTGKRIRLTYTEDGADYVARAQGFRDGKYKMGVFTIGALIKACATIGDLPVSIVAIIDETRGADAAVAYKSAIPNVDAMNNANVKFYLTPDSPAETLSRVIVSSFQMTDLASDPFVQMDGPEAVYDAYRKASPADPAVFFLWEPFVSKVLDNPNAHVVIDSSRFRGYIVDVIVVERRFLAANRDVVQEVVQAYFRAMFDHSTKMVDAAMDDAVAMQLPLNDKQATRLVDGVWFKNTPENYAHFAVKPSNYQHIEDMIGNLTRVLLTTGAIAADPTKGKPNLLYDDSVLRAMKDGGFTPSFTGEAMRDDTVVLQALSDAEWQALNPVGKMDVPPLVFARGTAKLTKRSQVVMDHLVKTLASFPDYYVLIKGNASRKGDLEANKKLAMSRAEAASQYLIQRGVNKDRLRPMAGEPSGKISVDFVFGQAY